MALCAIGGAESKLDSASRKLLKPQLNFVGTNGRSITDPCNFRGALMGTTIGRYSYSRRVSLPWESQQSRCGRKADGIEKYWSGRFLVYIHPSCYRPLKLQYPLDVERLPRSGQINTELGTRLLGHAVSILTPESFRTIVNSEKVRGSEWL